MKILFKKEWHDLERQKHLLQIIARGPTLALLFKVVFGNRVGGGPHDAIIDVFVWSKPHCIWRAVITTWPAQIPNSAMFPVEESEFWRITISETSELITQIIDEID